MARTYRLQTMVAGAPEIQIDFRGELNEQQYAAVTSPPGPALVIAGAGSGKTRTLIYRVAYLLANAIAPENILLLTFTNKAAREMLGRVNALVPGRAAGVWGGTFHSIGNRLLRRHATTLGFTRSFSILDSDDQRSMLTRIIEAGGYSEAAPRAPTPNLRRRERKAGGFPKAPVVAGLISLAVNTLRPLEEVIRLRNPYFLEIREALREIAAAYARKKKQSNSMDFDDLLARTVDLLRADDALRRHYQSQFQFILVDEYQDTNALQSEMIDLLAGSEGNVMVVGDDAQSIYSWRGASFDNILKFPERHAQAPVYRIETNYRSVPDILDLANEAIRANTRQFRKTLQPARVSAGVKPALVVVDTPQVQAAFVSQRLRELHESDGVAWREMAVLYRAHHQSMDVQLQLTQDRIPFVITSGLRFFEQAHIKDAISFLKWAANPRDEVSFDRMVRLLPGVGPAAAGKLWADWSDWLGSSPTGPAAGDESGAESADARLRVPGGYSAVLKEMGKIPARARTAWTQLGHVLDEFIDESGGLHPPSDLLGSVIDGIYEDYLRENFENASERKLDLDQLRAFAERFGDLDEMLAELALLTNADDASPRGAESRPPRDGDDAVALTSVHQAKGLEWKVVFLIWLTDGMFPNNRAIEESGIDGFEEERRLFYVAVTRAMDQLYLCLPQFWPGSYSGESWQVPSPFVAGLPPELYEEWKIGGW